MTSKHASNLDIVRSFLTMAFNDRQPSEAAADYLGDSYRQPDMGVDGPAAFVRLAEEHLRAAPDLRLTVQLLIGEGDWVVAQSLVQRHPLDRGRQVMDTFELGEGRIVGHWDVMQELPENAAGAARAA
jgi:predicted SnoaL-like aldol condensation-catalyzing enzyme